VVSVGGSIRNARVGSIKIVKRQDYRILVVDDEPANVYLLSRMLRDSYRVAEARSGEEALAIAHGPDKPALILLDVMMPEIDGFEVCRRLKADDDTKDIIVIFVTAIGDSAAEEVGLNLGAADYITKPISLPIVRARVRNQINMRLKADMLEAMSYIDGLTHVYNRRKFDSLLHQEWQRARISGKPLGLIMIDFDHFKALNDHYGHGAGDICLQQGAAALGNALRRQGDLLARYGGEEFVALLPETDLEGARVTAEAMREAVKALKLEHKYSSAADHVTISLGVAAALADEAHAATHLLELADRALNRAKAEGRDRVVLMDASLLAGLDGEKLAAPRRADEVSPGAAPRVAGAPMAMPERTGVTEADSARIQDEQPQPDRVLSALSALYRLPLSAELHAELDSVYGAARDLVERFNATTFSVADERRLVDAQRASGVLALPDSPPDAASQSGRTPASMTAVLPTPSGPDVLLVEDDYANRVVLEAMLARLGCTRIDKAGDGASALAALARTKYDLVLMDCLLPDQEGTTLVAGLRRGEVGSLNQQVPVVAMSGLGEPEMQARCLQAGMNAFLTKPLDLKRLGDALSARLHPSAPGGAALAAKQLSAVATPADTSSFDLNELMRRLGDDREIAEATIEQFLADAPSRIKELRAAQEAGDAEQLRFKAHSLKGLAGAVSAGRLQELNQALERAATDGATDGDMVQRIEREFVVLEPLLRAELGASA
jgi:diguanylate cyclase (GGDEF)-like protein